MSTSATTARGDGLTVRRHRGSFGTVRTYTVPGLTVLTKTWDKGRAAVVSPILEVVPVDRSLAAQMIRNIRKGAIES